MSDLYFAFGSNLKATRIADRVPSAMPLCTALLSGWRFTIDKRSIDGSGKANLTSAPDARAWGFVYRIDPVEWMKLDSFEPGYDRTAIDVLANDGRLLSAQTYIACEPAAGLVAFDWYKALIVDGARERGLPTEYIAGLESIFAKPDPNALA